MAKFWLLLKAVVQMSLLMMFVQFPQLVEAKQGIFNDDSPLIVDILYWSLFQLVIGYTLVKLRQKYYDTSSGTSSYSYLKVVGLVLASITLQSIILNVFPERSDSSNNLVGLEFFQKPLGFLSFISVQFFAPVWEEMVLRGIFQERIKNHFNLVVVVIVSSSFFALFHGFAINRLFVIIVCTELLYSWLYHRTNKVRYSMAARILNNGMATMLMLLDSHWPF